MFIQKWPIKSQLWFFFLNKGLVHDSLLTKNHLHTLTISHLPPKNLIWVTVLELTEVDKKNRTAW